MATEIRAKEDFRMMSPDRDLKHCLVPMMKGAAQLCEVAFNDDGVKLSELGNMIQALCFGVNDAKLPNTGTVMDVLQRLFDNIRDVDPEVQLMFMRNFMYITVCRYVAGLRETTTKDTLSETDIFDISVVSGMALYLPVDAREAFIERMRDRNKWGCLDDLGIFTVTEVADIPPEALRKEYAKNE